MGGLLAIGGGLSASRLLDAYCQGIFPWGMVEGHPLWYSPDPRMVLFPDEFRLSRSLRRTLRRGGFALRCDTDFAGVVAGCAAPRCGQSGTWIGPEMMAAYGRLHALGWAHSVETYAQGELVGGLYGLLIGRVFFGESMFARRRDASKVAFAHLIRQSLTDGIALIDCQMRTEHLASLGGREIPGADFLARLPALTAGAVPHRPWRLSANAWEW